MVLPKGYSLQAGPAPLPPTGPPLMALPALGDQAVGAVWRGDGVQPPGRCSVRARARLQNQVHPALHLACGRKRGVNTFLHQKLLVFRIL